MRRICALDEIAEGAARGFEWGRGISQRAAIVIKRGETLLAYENVCPHAGTPLDWRPDQFFDASGKWLQCATHAALFQVEDGVCVSGPCVGDKLWPMTIEVRDGDVYLTEAPTDEELEKERQDRLARVAKRLGSS